MFLLKSRLIGNVALIFCKILSGFILGVVLAIIIQVLTNCSTLSFIFIVISTNLAFVRLTWYYKFTGLMVTNLFFMTIFFLFKLYVRISAI